MARFDIMPYESAHGGHDHIVTARLGALSTNNGTAETSFEIGEVLLLDVAVGDVNVMVDGTNNVITNHYIAAVSSTGLITHYNFVSGAATHDCLVQMYPVTGPNAGRFYCENIYSNSDTLLTAVEMAALPVGDTVAWWRDDTTGGAGPSVNGIFGIDTNAGVTGLKLDRKLDAQGRDSDISGQACVGFVVITDGV